MFDATVSNDGRYLLIGTAKDCDRKNLLSYADIQSEQYANLDGQIEPTVVVNEWLGEFDYLQNHGTQFFFKSNLNAQKSKVLMIDFANPDPANWVDVIPEQEGVLDAARCCNDKILACYIENASEKLRVYDFNIPS